MTDRHYALFANNQHPLQLSMYEEYNRFLRNLHNKQYREDLSAQGDRINEVLEERATLLNQTEGESLSYDDYQDIYIQVMGEVRSKQNFSLNTRSKNGEISDYLEVRRPFGAAQ
jgi:hypothetical protein